MVKRNIQVNFVFIFSLTWNYIHIYIGDITENKRTGSGMDYYNGSSLSRIQKKRTCT